MFKENEITAELIRSKFPDVAAELADAAKPEITAETVKADYPGVAAALLKEGADSVDTEAAIDAAVEAEFERIRAIEALVVPGASEIVASLKFDRSATVESVKVAIFDAQMEGRIKMAENIAADGSKVAELVKEIGAKTPETDDDEAAIGAKMAEIARNIKKKGA